MDGDRKTEAKSGQDAGNWQYKAEEAPAENFDLPAGAPQPASSQPGSGGIEWSASEFVAHEKGAGWYVMLFLLAAFVSTGLYFATRDILSVIVVIVMAASLAVASARKPRVIDYRLDAAGLTAGNKFYPLKAYKSFAMPEEGPFASVVLIPLKRLDFPVSAYLAPDSQQQVVEILSSYLPLEHRQLDSMDRLMRSLRF